MLISKQPLTDEIRNQAFGELTEDKYEAIHLLYPAPDGLEDNLINRVVQEGWQQVADSVPIDISPTTDDRPFVGQMGLLRNLKWEKPARMHGLGIFGFPISKVIVCVIILVALLLVVPLNLVPYVCKGPRLRAAPWLYFFTIGLAFMAVEVVLIQKYTLFVGPSAYSVSAILLALLIGSGVGSRFAKHVRDRTAFAGIVVWLVLEVLVLNHVTGPLGGLSMPLRIVIAGLLVMPLGFFMGMPFPKGGLRVGSLVDWGLAVNGVASVLGGAAAILAAMTFGFRITLLGSAVLYLFAYLLLRSRAGWAGERPAGGFLAASPST